MRSRPVALLVAVIVAALALLIVDWPGGGDESPPAPAADYVIVAGVPGLRWDDVSETTTPALWRMAQRGAIGSLAVRSARQVTCPADGWTTLGAGNFAQRTRETVLDRCSETKVTIERPDEIGANVPDQAAVVDLQRQLPFGAVPGALAESVRCTTAVGPGAAVAAARPFGRVDHYAPVLPEDATALLSTCVLSIVELGVVDADTPEARAAQAAAADALLARLDAQRPEASAIVIAGVSDTGRPGHLHVVAIDGPGWTGWLNSITTERREGYLELIDLAPTALGMLDREAPKRILAGSAAAPAPGRPDDLAGSLAELADADRRASASLGVNRWFFTVLAGLQIAIFLVVVPLLRRSYRHAGPTGPTSPPAKLVHLFEVLLIGAALILPAAIAADMVPWWRASLGGLIFGGTTLGLTALATFLVVRLPPASRTLFPLGVGSALAAGVICIDLLTGARLQLNGVVGYSALQGGRYAGMGIVVMGVFIAGAMMAAGWLAHLVPQRHRTLVFAAMGGLGVVLVGSPSLGADAGGAVALTVGVALAAALATGGWLTFSRLAWALLGGFGVTIGFALADVRRPLEHQGSLGRLLNQFAEGTASLTLHRVGLNNASVFASSALTVLAIAAAVFAWAVLMRPWGGLKRLFGIYPAIKAAAVAVTTAALIAGLLGGAALNAAGAAAATALPLLTLTALRVLEHAADRTRAAAPEEPQPAVPQPEVFPGGDAQERPGGPVTGSSPAVTEAR